MGYTLTRASALLFAGVVGILSTRPVRWIQATSSTRAQTGTRAALAARVVDRADRSGTTGSSARARASGAAARAASVRAVSVRAALARAVSVRAVSVRAVSVRAALARAALARAVVRAAAAAAASCRPTIPRARSYRFPVVSVVTPIGQAATQLVGTMSQQNELDLMQRPELRRLHLSEVPISLAGNDGQRDDDCQLRDARRPPRRSRHGVESAKHHVGGGGGESGLLLTRRSSTRLVGLTARR